MGVDFMSLESEQSMASQAVANGIERLDELTKELRDYFVAPEPQLAVAEPDILLTQVVHEIEAELKRREVHLHVLYSSPLPHVRLDRAQIRDAFKRVMDFCQALLSNGGELEINAGRKTIDGQEWIELTLTSKTASTLEIDETNVFKPFLQVNGIQVGLSMAIAREILRRHHGQIVFRKESPRRGRIAILMKVSSAQRHKSRVTNMADIGGRFGITEQSEQQR
jgi:signal transduction histidine kinase